MIIYHQNTFIVKERNFMFYSKCCPLLATTFSHLSGSIRIPRQKNTSFLEAIHESTQFLVFHMWKIGVQRFSALVHMEPNFLVFESFPIEFIPKNKTFSNIWCVQWQIGRVQDSMFPISLKF